jgi:hypothetical protein
MTKTITKLILVAIFIWALWVGYQYHTKSKAAEQIAQQAIDEFYSSNFQMLLQDAGKGKVVKVVHVDGRKFWVTRSISAKGDTVRMKGRVDFVELFPGIKLRLGHTFNPALENK